MDEKTKQDIALWAQYVRGSNGEWKKYHTAYLDAYINMKNAMYRWMAQTPEGKKKIIEIFGIKNFDAVPMVK